MNLRDTLVKAAAAIQAGDFKKAEALCRSVLATNPANTDAMQMLGVAMGMAGDFAEGSKLLEEAARLAPSDVNIGRNLINVLVRSDREDHHQRALSLVRAFLLQVPTDVTLRQLHAIASEKNGQHAETVQAYLWLIRNVSSNDPATYCNAALAMERAGNRDQAILFHRHALKLKPDHYDSLNALARLLPKMEWTVDAIQLMRFTLKQEPNSAEARVALASLLLEMGQVTEAQLLIHQAMNLRPDSPILIQLYAKALLVGGRIEEALNWFERGCELAPSNSEHQDAVLMTSLYREPDEPDRILHRHRKYDVHIGQRFQPIASRRPTKLDRRLRIGYVSADFWRHSVGMFIAPVLAAHNQSRVEVHCFNTIAPRDDLTVRMRESVEHWHQVEGLDDDALAKAILERDVDILVDLAGHTTYNRLPVFARKPAPVQISYLGYPATSGLSAIDFRVTDAIADPPGKTDSHHTETLLHLPGSFGLFAPIEEAPPVSSSPCQTNGYVTAGCVAALFKITPKVILCWANAMKRVPTMRLILVGNGMTDEGVQSRLRAAFEAHAVDPERIEWIGKVDFGTYLALHSRIDFMLDVFPFNGHTTTVQGLWMGVPIVTCAGVSHRSRMGASVLTCVGLTDWITSSPEAYVERIVEVANAPAELVRVRAGLRDRVAGSPLVDAQGYTKALEDLLIGAWNQKAAS